jgi:hypothetical protein
VPSASTAPTPCPGLCSDGRNVSEGEVKKVKTKQNETVSVAISSIMRFGGRVKLSKKMLDESFGRNLSSFIIKKISIDIDLVFSFITLSFWNL